MKKYFLDGKRINKTDFDGYLYLFYCLATAAERKEAKECFKSGKEWNGLKVVEIKKEN